MNDVNNTNALVAEVGSQLVQLGSSVTTVESCTGGGLAYALTAISGSSNWFERGYVTYSNAAKTEMVGVPEALLKKYGAVSNQVAQAMALGGLKYTAADYALSVSGIAGPDGGTKDKPVGTVCFGWAGPWADSLAGTGNYVDAEKIIFSGNREQVRQQSIVHSLAGLLKIMRKVHSVNA